MKCRFSTRP